MSRRRFLAIVGAAAGLGAAGWVFERDRRPRHVWRGFALGGPARIVLLDGDSRRAQRLGAAVAGEIRRLERIFSLHDQGSEIARLNRDRRLDGPSLDMVALLSSALQIASATGGAFDPTIQPLWRLLAQHFARPDASPAGPPPRERAAALALVGFEGVDVGASRVVLGRRGAALTLNGIAQGYIADRVAGRLRDAGLEAVLVDTGEIVAGKGPDEGAWSVQAVRRLTVSDAAVATSSAAGTVFEPTGRFHHLIDPRSGACPAALSAVTVVAPTATRADALSTALAAARGDEILPLARRAAGTEVHLAWPDGRVESIAT
ncbi:MAG: FAD:protein FMN transferase [Alphaproteobacteria bacterium]